MKISRNAAGEKYRKSRAFTMPELLIVVVVIVVLVLLIIPALNRPYSKAPRIKCSSNLKQIALAFKMYARDNNEKLPWEIAGDSVNPQLAQQTWKYFQAISNELGTAKILLCPGDLTRLQNVARRQIAVGCKQPSKPLQRRPCEWKCYPCRRCQASCCHRSWTA
jgi:prepilin-type N-terminal cleavage/methylation domain-containing protein